MTRDPLKLVDRIDSEMDSYSASANWTKIYDSMNEVAYPAEGVIRIFKGDFPNLKFPKVTPGERILDLGCGDGRHLKFLSQLGFTVTGVEISQKICELLQDRFSSFEAPIKISVGHAAHLDFADNTFDRLLAWNSCYYMSMTGPDFDSHVAEMARVLKPQGWITVSIPKKTNFIFEHSSGETHPGYRVIRDDYFGGSRDGELMRCFADRSEIEASFGRYFCDFSHADLDMEWFGLAYHWHVFCARVA